MAYDVYIQLVPADQYTGIKFYSFGQTRSLAVRGLSKLVTVFAKFLLTPVGTNPLDPDEGTDLTGLIGSNISVADAHDVVTLAVSKAVAFIHGQQNSRNVPNDERLANAQVVQFVDMPEAPGLAVQILVRNVAGIGLNFLIPSMTARP